MKVPDKVILLLSINEFTLKDSFDAVAKIKNIPLHMFDDGYNYVSFDVESLFTNVSIKRTIDIILKRIYIDKVISTKFKKRSMKNLLLDTCTKTAFIFNGVIYEQRDSVCMGCNLGSLLANILIANLVALLQRIGLTLPKSCFLKIQSNGFKTCFIRIKTQYNVNNIKFYCNTKVKTTALHNLFVYDFSWPGCGANYIGKTEKTLYEKAVEHVWAANNSTGYNHLSDCIGVQHLLDIASLNSPLFTSSPSIQKSDKLI